MNLKLYFAPGSSAFAPLVALEEAAANFETVRIDLADGEQRSANFLAVNPRGRVPALEVGGRVVTENVAILTYIATRFPDARLLPLGDLVALARAYELLSWFTSGIHIEIAKMWRSERFTDDPAAKPYLESSGRAKFDEAVEEIERIASSSGKWLLGDRFSVVDAFGLVIWRWTQRLAIDPATLPNWGAQVARAFERPAVQRAVERETAKVLA